MKRAITCLGLAVLALAPAAFASPLLDSVRAGEREAATALLRAGADVRAAESNGTTALHWAVHHGDLAMTQRLIEAGADVNASNAYGATPLSEAALLGDVGILAALLDAGADPESPNA